MNFVSATKPNQGYILVNRGYSLVGLAQMNACLTDGIKTSPDLPRVGCCLGL